MPAESSRSVIILEDWQPVIPELRDLLTAAGHQVQVLPNLIELAGKRIHRDLPRFLIVNAPSLLIGRGWDAVLDRVTALLVVSDTAGAAFLEEARGLRFDGLIEPPVSDTKLALAIDIAERNGRASRRLRFELRRLDGLSRRRAARAAR
jgi:hypothetical protein